MAVKLALRFIFDEGIPVDELVETRGLSGASLAAAEQSPGMGYIPVPDPLFPTETFAPQPGQIRIAATQPAFAYREGMSCFEAGRTTNRQLCLDDNAGSTPAKATLWPRWKRWLLSVCEQLGA